jgi:hypothetical protein
MAVKKSKPIIPPVPLTQAQLDDILRNWNTTVEFLKTAPLEHVEQLFEYEEEHMQRIYILRRLLSRIHTLVARGAQQRLEQKYGDEPKK